MADSPYVSVDRQLVPEFYVRDIERSLVFYQSLGFELVRRDDHFAVLRWEGAYLFLDQQPGLPEEKRASGCNVRVMVSDVDRYWSKVQDMGAEIAQPIGDRYYKLRDFTILDPDGHGLRFGSDLPRQE